MVRRRFFAVIGALCAVVALQGAPAASAQGVDTVARVAVAELPELRELPPLPAEGYAPEVEKPPVVAPYGMSAVQTVALVLAAGALVAGGTGLALVTRRGRG
jgi:hypothetical protein